MVAQSGFKTDLQEFNHTTEMIYKNFSNHSAWHTRSKILPGLFSGVELEHAIQQDLELVRNAIYTEPSDQSAWLYQRWLLGSGLALEPKKLWKSEYIHVKELNEIEPNCKCMT